jgi:hypothetical protein
MSIGSRIPAAEKSKAKRKEARANEALDLMQQALQILDMNEGPHDACAQLDVAINRLRDSIAKKGDEEHG